MKRLFLIGFSSFLVLGGCQKNQVKIQNVEQVVSKMTPRERDFLQSVKSKVSDVTLSERIDFIDPSNVVNFMDYFGVYYRDLILDMNESELVNPSNDKQGYLSKMNNLVNASPLSSALVDFIDPSSEFFTELVLLSQSTLLGGDMELTVAQLKAIENQLAGTALLGSMEKTYLLSLTASIKYSISVIKNNGLVVGDIVIDVDNLPQGWFDCFESNFMGAVKDGLSILADTASPFEMAAAWVAFPVTAATAVGDGLFTGVTEC